MAGEIERAKLFANVDELMAWKKTFELRQHDELVRQIEQAKVIENTIEGGKTTLECVKLNDERITALHLRIDSLETRADEKDKD